MIWHFLSPLSASSGVMAGSGGFSEFLQARSGLDFNFVIFPRMDMDFVMARVELAEGASSSQVIKIVREVSDKLQELDDSKPENEKFLVNISARTFGTSGLIMADVSFKSDISAEVIANEWRELVGVLAGARQLEFAGSMMSHGGSGDVGFLLIGSNPVELAAAGQMLEERLRGYAGVYEINSSGRGSIPEINIVIKPSAEALGLSLNDLASQVRAAFYGVEAQRIQRGEEEVRVMVRYPEHQRESLGNLESMTIRTADGDEVPFTAVAEIEERMSPATIEREWGKFAVWHCRIGRCCSERQYYHGGLCQQVRVRGREGHGSGQERGCGAFPGYPADLVDNFLRIAAYFAGDQPYGAICGSDGGFPGIWYSIRDTDHVGSDPLSVCHSG